MKKISLLIIVILVLMTANYAQPADIFEQRAKEIISILNDPKDLNKFFSPAFLAKVSPAQITETGKQLTASYGKAVKIEKIVKQNEYAGQITVMFETGVVGEVIFLLEDKSPFLVKGMQFISIGKAANSFEDIIAEMKNLPGQTALNVVKLNDKDVQVLAAHNADKPLAIGSTFKLYILSELVRSISAGERKWSDVVELTNFSLPSGKMQDWDKNSPVTLHTLATMMISISDNTATDQLLTTLGREKVEKMLSVTGNSNPNLTIPFLNTFEMFKLKGVQNPKIAEVYLAKDVKGKRTMLDNEIAKLTAENIEFNDFLVNPTYISQIEWFASTNDLARLMNWLRLNTTKSPADKARGVMTTNKGLPLPVASQWNYVGFKGGSETGVVSGTFLLQSKKGDWFVISGSWNDEKSSVDNEKFILLL